MARNGSPKTTAARKTAAPARKNPAGGGRKKNTGPEVTAAHGEENLRPPAASNEDATALREELERLKAQLERESSARKELEDRAARAQVVGCREDLVEIVPIPRPKGEAGDSKKGFQLQTEMKLVNGKKDQDLYDAILRSVHVNAVRANLDFTADYRQQDPEKLAQVFKLTRKEHKYLEKKRFPADWATAEMVKQYLRNKRKYAVKCGRIESKAARKERLASEARGTGGSRSRQTRHIDESGDDDDGNDEEDASGSDKEN